MFNCTNCNHLFSNPLSGFCCVECENEFYDQQEMRFNMEQIYKYPGEYTYDEMLQANDPTKYCGGEEIWDYAEACPACEQIGCRGECLPSDSDPMVKDMIKVLQVEMMIDVL